MNNFFSTLLNKVFEQNYETLQAMDVLTVGEFSKLFANESMIEYNLTMKAMHKNVNVDSYQFTKLLVDLGLRAPEALKEIKDTRLLTSEPIEVCLPNQQ